MTWLLILILSKESIKPSVECYMREIELCTIIWSPIFKISSFKCNIWSTSFMRGIYCTSSSYMIGIKQCTIIWSPRFKNYKLQIQLQEVPVSDLFLSNITYHNIFVSSDLAPDLDPFQGVTQVFSEPFNLDPQTSHLQNETCFSHPSVVTSNLTSPNLPLGRR